MSDREELAALRRLAELEAKSTPQAQKEEGMWTKVLGGALEPNATLLSGAVAAPVAGLAGIASAIGGGLNIPFLKDTDPADTVRKVQSALTYEPGTQGGKDAMSVIGAPFEMYDKAARWAGDTAADVTGNPSAGAYVYTGATAFPSVVGALMSPKATRGSSMGLARRGSEDMMARALKPHPEDVLSGDSAKAIKTMLNNGINATEGGGFKLQAKVDDLNRQVAQAIQNSTAYVGRDSVASRLGGVRDRVEKQALPASDIATVDAALREFQNTQPSKIPVQAAQDMKRGTYRQIRERYGEQGAARVEAEKGLARGLKEEIGAAVPETVPLNLAESEYLNALKMVERRAALDANKNPVGLMPLTPSALKAGVFLADRSALAKSLIARALNPGRAGEIGDMAMVAATAPQSFEEDAKRRQMVIDAILRSKQ